MEAFRPIISQSLLTKDNSKGKRRDPYSPTDTPKNEKEASLFNSGVAILIIPKIKKITLNV